MENDHSGMAPICGCGAIQEEGGQRTLVWPVKEGLHGPRHEQIAKQVE